MRLVLPIGLLFSSMNGGRACMLARTAAGRRVPIDFSTFRRVCCRHAPPFPLQWVCTRAGGEACSLARKWPSWGLARLVSGLRVGRQLSEQSRRSPLQGRAWCGLVKMLFLHASSLVLCHHCRPGHAAGGQSLWCRCGGHHGPEGAQPGTGQTGTGRGREDVGWRVMLALLCCAVQPSPELRQSSNALTPARSPQTQWHSSAMITLPLWSHHTCTAGRRCRPADISAGEA